MAIFRILNMSVSGPVWIPKEHSHTSSLRSLYDFYGLSRLFKKKDIFQSQNFLTGPNPRRNCRQTKILKTLKIISIFSSEMPPQKGKTAAGLLRRTSTWTTSMDGVSARWFRLPRRMTQKDFDISNFTSLIGCVPLTRQDGEAKNGKITVMYGLQMLFGIGHPSFETDFERAKSLKTISGQTINAVEKTDLWAIEKRLYLSDLPFDVELHDLLQSLAEFVDFPADVKKIFHLTNGNFSGQVMLKVAKFKLVPPPRVRLISGFHEKVIFSVFAKKERKFQGKKNTYKLNNTTEIRE